MSKLYIVALLKRFGTKFRIFMKEIKIQGNKASNLQRSIITTKDEGR
jgi:hypothetical protein